MVQDHSDEEKTDTWSFRHISQKGNNFLCLIDPVYLQDKFNLTGQPMEMHKFNETHKAVLGNTTILKSEVEKNANLLYGLVHARFILTPEGMSKMLKKYRKAEFGKCPRYFCNNQNLLPVGLTDLTNQETVKLFCICCQDLYRGESQLDGAYFGSSFPHMFFMYYKDLIPSRSVPIYTPKVFGFKVHQHKE